MIIKGTAIATKEYGTDIVLVGPVEKIETELATYDKPDANIEIVATNEYLAEGEHPGQQQIYVSSRLYHIRFESI